MTYTIDTATATDFCVRVALLTDLKFLDHLQRRFSHQIGYLPLSALESRVKRGCIFIGFENGQPIGFVHGVSPYLKRKDLAIIYQAAIDYDVRRRAIGTLIVQSWHAAVAPHASQVVLWCGQDIEANLFWKALGFEALAWRPGSVIKGRIHVYWSLGHGRFVPEGTRDGLLQAKRPVYLFPPGADWDARPKVDWSSLEVRRVAHLPRSGQGLHLPPSRLPSPGLPADAGAAAAAAAAAPLLSSGPRLVRLIVGGKFRLVEVPTSLPGRGSTPSV